MSKQKIWLPTTLILFLCAFLLGGMILPSLERLLTSFPEVFLGQIYLDRTTRSYSPRAYQSAEFVLDQVALSEIERANFIVLQEDVNFWEPQYVGFRRTELTEDEIRNLHQFLSGGSLFQPTPDGASSQCVTQDPLRKPILEECAVGKQYLDQYYSYQWEAEQNGLVGVLQFFLTGRRLAEIRVFQSPRGLAYTPYEKGGDWWLDGLTTSSSVIEELFTRAVVPSVPVLWPEMTTDQANARAARIIGSRYQPAQAMIQNSSAVREVFGEIQEIRPAVADNWYSSWMDSTSVFFTFRVVGTRGEGAVLIQGYDCFDLQMVFEGIPFDDGTSYVCQ